MDRYAFRAGELHSLDGELTGYALVLPMAWWTQTGGHLWWRRWSNPYVVADVWITAEGVEPSYTDAWMSGDVLDDELDLWDGGHMTVGEGARQTVRWLDEQASGRVARRVFDADLDALRRDRTGTSS